MQLTAILIWQMMALMKLLLLPLTPYCYRGVSERTFGEIACC